MNPQEVADRLLAHRDQSDFQRRLAELCPSPTVAIIAALKQRVDVAMLRNAGQAAQIAEVAQMVAAYIPDPEAEALALWMKGNTAYFLSNYQEALRCLQRAEAIYGESSNPLSVARLQINQVAVLHDMSEFATAIATAERARLTCAELGSQAQRYLAGLEMNVGMVYQQIGAPEQALAAYERGRAIWTALGELVEMARIDINRATVLQDMGRFPAAEELYRAARAALEAHELDQEVARADYNLGVLAHRRGQYQAALTYLEAAHHGFAAIPNPTEVAMIDMYRAFVYRDLNLLQETVTLAAAAEHTLKRAGLRWLRALALTTQGIGYQRLGAYTMAERILTRTRRLYRQQGANMRALLLDVDRAVLAFEAGRPATAHRLARRVERRIDAETWPAAAARTQLLLARCALARATVDDAVARRHVETALGLAERYALPERAMLYHALGQVLERTGDSPGAWQQYQTALRTIEAQRARLPLDDFQTGFMDDKLPIYADAARLARHHASPAQLFAILNLAHTAPIPRLTTATTAVDDDEMGAQLRTLRERWHWYQSRLDNPADLRDDTTPDPSLAATRALQHQIRALESAIADLTHRRQVRASAVATLPPDPAHVLDPATAETFLQRVQERLRPHEVLLHYFVLEESIGVAVVTASGIRCITDLTTTTALQRIMRAWRFHIEHVHARMSPETSLTTVQTYLSRLYTALITPIESFLTGCEHIFLILPPSRHDLPCAALYDGQQYLVERYQLTYLSAPEVLLQTLPVAPTVEHDATLHALVVGYSEGGRLPQAVAEARCVTTILEPGAHATCLLEDAASARRLRNTLPNCQLIHLATHAVFRPDNPLFSWIRLSDARLTVADLYEITLPRRPLVVLSACETGRGQPRGGGLLGMGRGFLAAGAAGLIVSLWKIEDQAAARVMADLYVALMSPQTRPQPSAALCAAQRQACARGEHPFGWAGFIFIQG